MKDGTNAKTTDLKAGGKARRRFLKGAAVASAGAAATVAMPNVSRAQTTVFKLQGAWGAQDIFNEFAEDFVTRVNNLAGDRLRIDYLLAGAVVKPFSLHDAVHSGILDGGHTVSAYWYGKHKGASLFGTGPYFGHDSHGLLGWFYYGGGQDLYQELMNDVLGLDVVGFLSGPMPPQPLGWFKQEITSADDLRGMKYRTVGLAADLMQEMGAAVTQLPGGEIVPAMERGVIDAFEYNNPTSDRLFGAQDVASHYMLGSYHQATEAFEIIFNKSKFDALPEELKQVIQYAAEAASSDMLWKSQDRYSKDLEALIEHGVNVQATPASVYEAQVQAWDTIVARLEEDPFMKKTMDSQKEWVRRVGKFELQAYVDRMPAYNHWFGSV